MIIIYVIFIAPIGCFTSGKRDVQFRVAGAVSAPYAAAASLFERQTARPQLAADLAQESFTRLTEQYPQGNILDIEAYLYKTAKNLMLDHLRQQQRRQTEAVEDDILAQYPPVNRRLNNWRSIVNCCNCCNRRWRTCRRARSRFSALTGSMA